MKMEHCEAVIFLMTKLLGTEVEAMQNTHNIFSDRIFKVCMANQDTYKLM